MIEIETGHMLSKHPDACRFPHGHSRKVEMILEGDILDSNEMVCDFKVLKETMHQFLMTWDHALAVNTRDPNFKELQKMYGERIIPFQDKDPTAEVMAKMIFDALRHSLQEYRQKPDPRYPVGPKVKVFSVKVWETSTSWATYSE
ncbi:MAG: 6-carboxytetrahydropterin synthase [Verrucomicrobia bacterium]|nr:6-carboxytetrahydropterin synthase [Verrucomicrobiota bacterium]